MKTIWFSVLGVVIALAGCDVQNLSQSVLSSLSGLTSGESQTTAGDSEQTVGSVTPDSISDETAGQTLPDAGTINGQVRNLSAKAADVTLRFVLNERVVHLTLVRVPAQSTTLVIGPEQADRLEVEGSDEDGETLPERVFLYGVDFDEGTAAVYQIGGGTSDPGDGGEGPDTPGVNDPPQITLVQPAADVAAAVGSAVLVAWTDADPDDNAVITLTLESASDAGAAPIQLAPQLAEDGDGANDSLQVVIEGVPEGVYDVVGTISDGAASDTSVAPGQVTVFADADNVAPTLDILDPAASVSVYVGESVFVSWTDEDDDPAMITFYLDTNEVNFDGGEIQISPPIAAWPDGADSDSAQLAIVGVTPGVYELLGVINDGELLGTARAAGDVIVTTRPTGTGSTPTTQPASCTTNGDCDDGMFCNGVEMCSGGECVSGVYPCSGDETCDETHDQCILLPTFCTSNGDCGDGEVCDVEYGLCVPRTGDGPQLFAYPDSDQPGDYLEVPIDSYWLDYFVMDYVPPVYGSDRIDFYFVSYPDEAIRVKLSETVNLDTDQPYVSGFTAVLSGDAEPDLIDCGSYGLPVAPEYVYLDLELVRTDARGITEEVLARTRVKRLSYEPFGLAPAVIELYCAELK